MCVLYSVEYKYALGGDTSKQGLVLLGLVRVVKMRAGDAEQAKGLFGQWWEHGLKAVEAAAAATAAATATASTDIAASGGGAMKPRTAVQKAHVLELLWREDEEDALDSLQRSHTMCMGRSD